MSLSSPTGASVRRHDLDWLRVIAFGLLIFYHIGMFYVSWDWHVKSLHAGPAIEPLMQVVNPWRLLLLFLISGVAIRYASDRIGAAGFARSRAFRLGLPLFFGMLFVVAPQTYFELRQNGSIEPGWWNFWSEYARPSLMSGLITPTWNHLWYVAYLLVYVLLLAPFLPRLRHLAASGRVGRWLGSPLRLVFGVAAALTVIELTLGTRFPTTHAFVDDWANHARSLLVLVLGYLVAKDEAFWDNVDRSLPLAVLTSLVLVPTRLFAADWYPALAEAIGETPRDLIWVPLRTLYLWAAILSVMGIARRYLREPSPALAYLTEGIFCFYIVHQTVIVAAGYAITPLGLPPSAEALLLIAVTVAACFASYEVARRIPGLRILFGVNQRSQARTSRPVGAALS